MAVMISLMSLNKLNLASRTELLLSRSQNIIFIKIRAQAKINIAVESRIESFFYIKLQTILKNSNKIASLVQYLPIF